MNNNLKTKKIVLSAMFAAMICVATLVIRIPTVGTGGYVNIGDAVILISIWILGNPYAALASGIGAGLADLLAGYSQYIIGTVVIKFAMGFIAYIVYKKIKNTCTNDLVSYIVSAIIAEVIMITGYFVYESIFLSLGFGALASIPSNAVQGITCAVIGVVFVKILGGVKSIKKSIG